MIVVSAAGGAAAELRWRERAARAARGALVGSLYTLIPFVTFVNLARLEFNADIGVGIVLGYVALAAATATAYVIGRRLELDRPAIGALLVCTLVCNSGYLGYPLTGALLGFDSLGEAVAYDILVVAPALLLVAFATGAAFGDRAGETPRDRVTAFFTRNPPLYAAIAGLLAPASLISDPMLDASRGAVIAMLPVGFFAVGAILAEEAEGGVLSIRARLRAPVAAILATRLVIAPGLLFLLALPFINLPGPYLLLAAMPCGVNTLLVAHVYGLDVRITAEAVAWSTAIVIVAVLAAAAL